MWDQIIFKLSNMIIKLVPFFKIKSMKVIVGFKCLVHVTCSKVLWNHNKSNEKQRLSKNKGFPPFSTVHLSLEITNISSMLKVMHYIQTFNKVFLYINDCSYYCKRPRGSISILIVSPLLWLNRSIKKSTRSCRNILDKITLIK